MLTNNKLSFLDSLFLMEQAKELVPGLRKVLGFYFDPFESKIACSVLDSRQSVVEEIDLEEDFDLRQIMKLRQQKDPTSWLQENELPFSLKRNQHIQRQVFDELDNVVLLLRYSNKDDGKMDLFYLFINADSSNFGLRKSDDVLKTDNKSIIGQLIYNSFQQILMQRTSLVQKQDQLKGHYTLLQSKFESQKQDHKKQQQDYHKQILNFCQYIISKQSDELGVHIEMSRELMEILSNYRGTIQSLEQLIDQAIVRANDTNTNILSPVLSLDEWHFDNLDQDIYQAISSPDELSVESRYLRSFAILDRMEDAARKLVGNREKLTGANVGKALPTPISAAAITDSIKKHQSKINSLCKQYPDRWRIIRNEFRPLMNVLHA